MGLRAAGISTPRSHRIVNIYKRLIWQGHCRRLFATEIRSSHHRTVSFSPTSSALSVKTPSSPHRANMSSSANQAAAHRHPDFKTVEASRPDWDTSAGFRFTKTADPSWTPGSGANSLDSNSSSSRKHIAIDPYEPGRPAGLNYKLLISAITPRPIGFISTRSGPRSSSAESQGQQQGQNDDGRKEEKGEEEEEEEETLNLAPFSYFNVVNNDPPLFTLGIASPLARPKDTLRNLVANGECTVNIISEHFLEAANATSVDAPPGCSEWAISGLTPVADCATVRAPRVGEAVFSVECRVESIREFESRATPGRKTGCLVVLEGTRFWAREDAVVDEQRSMVAPEVLRPVSRLGGIGYGRLTEAVELPRPVFERDIGAEGYEQLKKKKKKSAGTRDGEMRDGSAQVIP
ncbi:hypothetical protein F5Y19DRAFT_178611 [Xylariaceae sp. FL1651]|nr:hypothetical protein F5Y19DRAFT_178611 [Xylariaceae sp. FL1651]